MNDPAHPGEALKKLRIGIETSSEKSPWTDEEDAQLLKEVKANTFIDQIALNHKRTAQGVIDRLKQMVIVLPFLAETTTADLSVKDIYAILSSPAEDPSLARKLELMEASFKAAEEENEALRLQVEVCEEKIRLLNEEVQYQKNKSASRKRIIKNLQDAWTFNAFQPTLYAYPNFGGKK